jgi:flagellar protein FlgJ
MTISATDLPAYTDLASLGALKRGAAKQDPAAIRQVAQQFESMFTRMMLKSMRDATGSDPLFGSDQEQMYQGMADDQLSIQLSRGHGLGLADMLIRQLQKMGVAGASAAAQESAGAPGAKDANGTAAVPGLHTVPARVGASAYLAMQRVSGSSGIPGTSGAAGSSIASASAEVQSSFIGNLWPDAQQAGQQLGVDPRNLIAQAALETNWGRNMPQDGTGSSSHNLFGIKVSGDWTGSGATGTTQEYQGGTALNTSAQFRSYANATQSFQDYVALLRNSPRYSGALDTGTDAHAFATGLQRGGYATDPDYVHKLGAMAQTVSSALAQGGQSAGASGDVTQLKSADPPPLTPDTGAL